MSGSPDALALLYVSERSSLLRRLDRRGVATQEAGDTVQETFLRLMRAPQTDIRDARAYLHRTAESVRIDGWRGERRAAAVIDRHAGIADDSPDRTPCAEARLIAEQELVALAAAVEALPPRCREVLLLHRFEELSYAQIAGRLGISKNTVMVHLANAMTALRRRLRDHPAARG
jgi:RNA polymerase sigma-70 factor (ECF subfamily)